MNLNKEASLYIVPSLFSICYKAFSNEETKFDKHTYS